MEGRKQREDSYNFLLPPGKRKEEDSSWNTEKAGLNQR